MTPEQGKEVTGALLFRFPKTAQIVTFGAGKRLTHGRWIVDIYPCTQGWYCDVEFRHEEHQQRENATAKTAPDALGYALLKVGRQSAEQAHTVMQHAGRIRDLADEVGSVALPQRKI